MSFYIEVFYSSFKDRRECSCIADTSVWLSWTAIKYLRMAGIALWMICYIELSPVTTTMRIIWVWRTIISMEVTLISFYWGTQYNFSYFFSINHYNSTAAISFDSFDTFSRKIYSLKSFISIRSFVIFNIVSRSSFRLSRNCFWWRDVIIDCRDESTIPEDIVSSSTITRPRC